MLNNQYLELTANESFDKYIISLKTSRTHSIPRIRPISVWFVRPKSRIRGSYTIACGLEGNVTIDVSRGNEIDEPEGSTLYRLAEDSLIRGSLFKGIPAVNTVPDQIFERAQFSPSKPKCTKTYDCPILGYAISGIVARHCNNSCLETYLCSRTGEPCVAKEGMVEFTKILNKKIVEVILS